MNFNKPCEGCEYLAWDHGLQLCGYKTIAPTPVEDTDCPLSDSEKGKLYIKANGITPAPAHSVCKICKNKITGSIFTKRGEEYHQSCYDKQKKEWVVKKLIEAGIVGDNLKTIDSEYIITHLDKVGQKGLLNGFSERFLILFGSNGTGKTFLACKLAKKFIENGKSVKLSTVFWIIEELNSSFHPSSLSTRYEILKSLVRYDLLILDEVGRSTQSVAEKAVIDNILIERWNLGKATIICSNMKPKEIQGYFSNALLDRWLDSKTLKVEFNWKSMRR